MTNQEDKIFKPHIRINDTILGGLERQALQWLVKKMPRWMMPDMLTGIGLFATVVIFFGYWLSNFYPGFLWLASFGFFLNWFGDSLDGTLARYRKIERPRFGFYIDHMVDAIGQILIIFGLGISPYITLNVALLAVIGYLLLSIHVYIHTYVMGVFRISYYKMGPTEVRGILVLFNTAIFFFGIPEVNLFSISLTLYDILMMIATGIEFVLFVVLSIQGAIQLLKSDHPHK